MPVPTQPYVVYSIQTEQVAAPKSQRGTRVSHAVWNPGHLKNQIEGAVVMGLGGALFEAIELEGSKVRNPALSSYRVPRFSDVPILETVLVDRKDLPSVGAGETPIIAVAPAIGNAVFAATGIRCTTMPMAPTGLKLT